MKLTKEIKTAYAMALVLASDAAMAATGGLGDAAKSKFDSIATGLNVCGGVVLAIAIMWAGYKIMFQGQTLREVAPPLLGAILFASAATVANLLVG